MATLNLPCSQSFCCMAQTHVSIILKQWKRGFYWLDEDRNVETHTTKRGCRHGCHLAFFETVCQKLNYLAIRPCFGLLWMLKKIVYFKACFGEIHLLLDKFCLFYFLDLATLVVGDCERLLQTSRFKPIHQFLFSSEMTFLSHQRDRQNYCIARAVNLKESLKQNFCGIFPF